MSALTLVPRSKSEYEKGARKKRDAHERSDSKGDVARDFRGAVPAPTRAPRSKSDYEKGDRRKRDSHERSRRKGGVAGDEDGGKRDDRRRTRRRRRRSSRSRDTTVASFLLVDRVKEAKKAVGDAEAKEATERKRRKKAEQANAKLKKKLEEVREQAVDYKKSLSEKDSALQKVLEEKEETQKELQKIRSEKGSAEVAKLLGENKRIEIKQELRKCKLARWKFENMCKPIVLADSSDDENSDQAPEEAEAALEGVAEEKKVDYGGGTSEPEKESQRDAAAEGSASDYSSETGSESDSDSETQANEGTPKAAVFRPPAGTAKKSPPTLPPDSLKIKA